MNLMKDVSLKPFNSFKLDCIADDFVIVESAKEFIELLDEDIYKENDHLIIGWGTNILLTKKRFEGLVIKNQIMWRKIIDETDDAVTIKAGAGENRDEFVKRTLAQWYTGCENLISIPGTIWAAPMQNIWAYGVEVKDMIQNVEWIDIPSKASIILAAYECNFWYRDSVFKKELKDNFFITHVTFQLQKYAPETYFPKIEYGAIQQKLLENEKDGNLDTQITPQIVADAIAEIRASKLPNREELWTAGSFFKNPFVNKETYKKIQLLDDTIQWYKIKDDVYKLNAWQLIDLAGLKWIQHWHVGTYHKHALVLVNHGDGTWEELMELAARIQKIVKETFGIDIEPEVNFV